MQAPIVAGIKTGLTQDALRLRFSAIMSQNSGSDRASIGLNSLEFDLYPVLFSIEIIAQKGWIFVQIYNEHIEVTVIVEIPERASAATMRFCHSGTGSLDQLLEDVVA
jgi:hypothetical protein